MQTKPMSERIAGIKQDILRSNKGELDAEEVSGTFEMALEIIEEQQGQMEWDKKVYEMARIVLEHAEIESERREKKLEAENQALLAKLEGIKSLHEKLKDSDDFYYASYMKDLIENKPEALGEEAPAQRQTKLIKQPVSCEG